MTQTTETFPASGRLAPTGVASFSGMHAQILLGGTQAPLTVMDMTIDPGLGGPAHVSRSEDKVFHVTHGRLLFLVGEGTLEAGVGATIFVAKGITHGFRALGDDPARMVLVSTPARHDRFFVGMDELPTPHRMEDVEGVCERFDQEIVGPIPSA